MSEWRLLLILVLALLALARCEVHASGGISQFEQQLSAASLGPFTTAASDAYPVAEQWYFMEGVTASGVHFAYLNTVARYAPKGPYSASLPIYGASVDDVCAIGKPLGRPFSGSLERVHNRTGIVYEGEGALFGVESPGLVGAQEFHVRVEDNSAGISSLTTAFGPMFTFQYTDVSLKGQPRGAYVQVMGSTAGELLGEPFTGWGGVEYHRGHQPWGKAPPFAGFWYKHWLLRANTTVVDVPSYSMVIVGSEESGFFGGYEGEGKTAELIESPTVQEFHAEDCGEGEEPMPSSILVEGLTVFEVNTRIASSQNFWWVARIVTGLFGWWEVHSSTM